MYRLRNASKLFDQGTATVRAIDGVDLDIGPGEFVVIEGPSGSGKTTLLQLLGGLDRPSGGELWFGDDDLGRMRDRDLARLRLRTFGFVFQQFNLIPTLNALENVEAAMAPLGGRRAKNRDRARRLLDGVGLTDRVDHLPPQLSGGEQQRVAIARALAKGPQVILADEPTGNLDSRTGREIIALLRRLAADLGQTVVVITHDPTIAGLSPRVVQIRDGHIVADGPGSALGGPAPAAHHPEPVAMATAASPAAPAASAPAVTTDWIPTDSLPASSRPEILRAEGVRKVYVTGETPVEVLKGLSLSVHEGEFVTLTGPSGSGKTTMLNCLSGLDRIDAGRVLVDGQAVHDIGDADRSRLRAQTMGFIFQAWNLVPVFSAVENAELPLLLAGVSANKARKAAAETLERVGLGHRLHHRPGELSGGEQQRVAIARALANRPRLVWADEPTGNLDSETAGIVMSLLRDMHRDGLTVVLVTHDESIAESGTRRIRMRDGVILGDHTRPGGARRTPAPAGASRPARSPGPAPAAPPAPPAPRSAPVPAAAPAEAITPGPNRKTLTKAERREQKRQAVAARRAGEVIAPSAPSAPPAPATPPPPAPRPEPEQQPRPEPARAPASAPAAAAARVTGPVAISSAGAPNSAAAVPPFAPPLPPPAVMGSVGGPRAAGTGRAPTPPPAPPGPPARLAATPTAPAPPPTPPGPPARSTAAPASPPAPPASPPVALPARSLPTPVARPLGHSEPVFDTEPDPVAEPVAATPPAEPAANGDRQAQRAPKWTRVRPAEGPEAVTYDDPFQ